MCIPVTVLFMISIEKQVRNNSKTMNKAAVINLTMLMNCNDVDDVLIYKRNKHFLTMYLVAFKTGGSVCFYHNKRVRQEYYEVRIHSYGH